MTPLLETVRADQLDPGDLVVVGQVELAIDDIECGLPGAVGIRWANGYTRLPADTPVKRVQR